MNSTKNNDDVIVIFATTEPRHHVDLIMAKRILRPIGWLYNDTVPYLYRVSKSQK